jgi:hypothetical protein
MVSKHLSTFTLLNLNSIILQKLELNQMENLEGGIDNKDAAACGFGVGIATFGWGLLGPFALLGLTLCMHGDS